MLAQQSYTPPAVGVGYIKKNRTVFCDRFLKN